MYMTNQHSKIDSTAPLSTRRSYAHIHRSRQEGKGGFDNPTIIGQGLSYSIKKMSELRFGHSVYANIGKIEFDQFSTAFCTYG
jgi:hypothetical protein